MPTVTSARAAAPTLVRLLDAEPELAKRLREDDRAEARARLRLRAIDLEIGASALGRADHRAGVFGLLVLDGLLIEEVQVAGRRAQQLLGAGDVVLFPPASDASLRVSARLVVAAPSRAAVLDDRLQGAFALWPGLALGLLERAGCRIARGATQEAISQLPRVEDRLEATFWDLADRWGHVTPSGIRIPLQLTHQTLAMIVGGRRPTISLALATLAERGIVTRHRDGTWLVVARSPTLPPNEPDLAPPVPIAVAAEKTSRYGGHDLLGREA